MLYPRNSFEQAKVIGDWREALAQAGRPLQPVMEPLYIDLAEDPEAAPRPIHLGFELGTKRLCSYLRSRQEIGVNHVALNLRFNQADVETTLKRLSDDVVADFSG